MKVQFNLCFVLAFLFLFSTVNTTTSFAQDSPQLIHRFSSGGFDIAFSPDSNTLAIAGEGTVSILSVATGNFIGTILDPPSGLNSIAFSPDGSTLAGAGWDRHGERGYVFLWDIVNILTGNFNLRHTLERAGPVYSVAFSPDGSTLAVGGGPWSDFPYPHDEEDWGILLYDVATGDLRKTLTGHTGAVSSVTFMPPNGFFLASGSGDGTARIWHVSTGDLRNTFKHFSDGLYPLPYWVGSVAFSPNGHTLATGNTHQDSSIPADVRLWSVGGDFLRLTLEHTYNVYSVAYSPDGTLLASGGGRYPNGEVRLWDPVQGFLRHTLELEHSDSVHSVAFSPDGTTLASISSRWVHIWSLTPPPITFPPAAITDPTFVANTPITPVVLPEATGGTPPYSYTLSPIPDGLAFDTTIRELSGTPTTLGTTEVTYTAIDVTSTSASLTFTITVTDAPATGITFVPSVIDDLTLSVNTPMEPVSLPLAEGGPAPYTYTLDPIPVGLSFNAAIQQLSGTPTTVGTTAATYTATDATGASGSLTFTIEVIGDGAGPGTEPLDVNGDGQVTVIDLAIVALFYGTRVPVGVSLPADVNADGVVDLADLTAIAQGIDAAGGGLNQLSLWEVEAALLAAVEQAAEIEGVAGAPGRAGMLGSTGSVSVRFASKNVADALSDVKHLTTGDVRLGKELTVLSELLHLLTELTTTPETTALLPNYPNPFNPETWIPYHLAESSDVTLCIYSADGRLVRQLTLGHQSAGIYQSKSRAAYWDGRNNSGEPVASGVYFYTLTAGDFTATRKMLIRK